MGGGIVRGLVSGLVVSLVILAFLSLSMPLPDRSAPPASAAPQPEDPAAVVPAPDMVETAPTPSDSVPVGDREPEPVPVPVPEASVVDAPEPVESPPAAPAEITLPAQPVAGAAAAAPGARLPQVGTMSATAPPASVPLAPPVLGTTRDPGVLMDAPAPPPAETVAAALPQPQPAPVPIAPSPRFTTTADADAGGTAPRRIPASPATDQLVAIDTTPPPTAKVTMPTPALDPILDLRSEAGLNAALESGAETDATPAPIDRPSLPQISAPPVAEADMALAPPATANSMVAIGTEPATQIAAAPVPVGALFENATAFDVPSDQPIMAVVLIDDPANPLDPAILAQISFPVSFAVDPLAADASARAAQLRAAGFEVVILAAGAIPLGASPSDVEVALGAARDALPQAVALMDNPEGRIQSERPVLEATVASLVDSGHGLIAFARGLNAAETTAQRAGLAAATAFRVLDDEDQRAPLITRYLDRAAFAAGQQGAVIVVGRTRPDTITAIFSWALSGRVEGVQLAPVSAVLQRGIE